jgi:methylated-DNA-[protein]-cysteine S-methyltransferase
MSQDFLYTAFNTPYGWVGILGSPAGLRCTTLPQTSEKEAVALLVKEVSQAKRTTGHFLDLIERFQAYFSGQTVDFPDRLDFSSFTPFQRAVWEATRRIPHGQTRSYGWIAQQMGKPSAVRAVGQALGRNPFPIIVPCHRVLAGDGGLGGFSGGLNMKKSLLELEKKSAAK